MTDKNKPMSFEEWKNWNGLETGLMTDAMLRRVYDSARLNTIPAAERLRGFLFSS